MDPFLLLLANAIAAGVSTVAGTLIQKGVVDAALEPATEKIKQRVQSGVKAIEKDDALTGAILAAIEDAAGQSGEALAVKYAERMRLRRLIEPGNESLRTEAMRLMLLASSDNPALVSDSLLNVLNLDASMRPDLARWLFFLRRRLYALPAFKTLLDVAHQQSVESTLQTMVVDLSALARTVDGDALRVRVVDREWNVEPYLRYLANECNRLRLSAIDPQYVTLNGESKITLAQVYTDLEVETLVRQELEEGKGKRERDQMALQMERGESRRMTALQAVSDEASPRVVLLGAPGSGKSTFASYLTFCLTMARLEPNGSWLEKLSGWNLGTLIPVRIILRDLATWTDGDTERLRKPTAQTLWNFIQHDLTENGFADSFAPLKEYLQTRGGLVILDGLDEVPDANARREFVKNVMESFARANPLCRFVVTCRPYAYRDAAWKLEGFAEHTLAPFSQEQIGNFVNRWYETVAPIQGWSAAYAQSKAEELIGATQLPHLASLADRPLLLTLMATLHTSRGKLPDDRADLYEDCVALMLDYWQRGKDTLVHGERKVEDGVLSVLGIARDDLESALARVAFQAHRRQGQQTDRKPETANITGAELRDALAPMLGDSHDRAKIIIHYIQTRAGLLAEHGDDVYQFPHRTFQEFLAACDVLNSQDFPTNLAEFVCNDRDWWREVFLLAAGRSRKRNFGQAVALIDALYDKPYHAGDPISDSEAYAAALAAQAAIEIRLRERATSPGRYQNTLRKLQTWLVGIITQGALPLVERADVGRILGALGDPRPDVSCAIPAVVDVAEGEFVMGSKESQYDDEKPQHRVTLAAYRIGKYPVTNAQYRRFVDDGGYTDTHQDCWTKTGWEWRASDNLQQPLYWNDMDENIDNHPVNGVSWYEAVAYCNWLTKTNLGRKFHLPTEAEWECAARHTDAREYPWVGEFDSEKANTSESGISRTTAVGLFSKGASVCGALDMAGNVWEWCRSLGYGEYKYKSSGPEEDGSDNLEGNPVRALRGGAWFYYRDDARCACRSYDLPGNRNYFFGFRVAESSPGS